MAFTINQPPRLQIGDAQLGSATDQVALIWQTTGSNSGDSFVVEYRPANSNDSWQTASTPTTIDTTTGGRLNHETTITGLDYDSNYEYRVQHFRNGSLINTYQDSFETRLPAGDQTPFTFAAYGDSAYINGNSGFREVQGQINQSSAEFALLLGDNAYNSGTHTEFDARFTDRYAPEALEWTASHIDYGAIGNHESYTNNGQPYLDSYVLPEPDNAPVAEKSYSFDYGDVHFVTFDTNTLNNPSALDRELDYVEADLQAYDAQWKVVFAHHPVAGVPDKGEDPGDNYYRQVVPRLNALGVDLLLTGHSHTYGWTYPLTGYSGISATFVEDTDKEYDKGVGVVQVVSGMGGKSIRSGSYNNFPFIAEGFSSSTNPQSEHGFSLISVTPDRLTVDYVAADNGEVLDSFSLYDNSATNPNPNPSGIVLPTIETPPEVNDTSAPNLEADVDDPAIYLNKNDASKSIVITTLKKAGLVVYDLQGQEIQRIRPEGSRYNNVDIVYDFQLGNEQVDLAVVSDRANDTLVIYEIDPNTGQLTDITAPTLSADSASIFGIDDGSRTAYGLAT